MATTPATKELPDGVILGPQHNFQTITDKISDTVQKEPVGFTWLALLAFAFMLVNVLVISVAGLLYFGLGVWGINVPVSWGFAIVNFVWWIGIGHAGTLISAILLLLRQRWRTSINRFSEAMTLFAVACAGLFPLLHMGRPWFFYWLMPYPNTFGLWPQWRSPLVWDVFAVSTYATVSLLFWYVGLVPDLATMRDRATAKWQQVIYGILALGWRNSNAHWDRYEVTYGVLAGLATPLVVSVHTVVSFDFAGGIVPGWHTTIFPPYFVAGAIYSGFAMVLTLTIPARYFYKLEDMITITHLDFMGRITLATGMIVGYGYAMELFMAWYSANKFEMGMMWQRTMGLIRWEYYALIFCNVLTPQLLWFKTVRTSPMYLFIISIIVNIGMWLERYVIVIGSLSRDNMPSAWGRYAGTLWDWGMYLGTIGLFLFLMAIFARVLPMIAMFEMKLLLPEAHPHSHDDKHGHGDTHGDKKEAHA
jgi:molybdopterin-containing oxidoreductase family membrane subunit